MKVYVAGPFLPAELPEIEDRKLMVHASYPMIYHNVEAAIEIGARLLEMGHNAYIPHLTYYTQMHLKRDLGEQWYGIDLDWLRCCDAILMIGDWRKSKGAVRELEEAKRIGLKIYYYLEDVPNVEGSK